MNTEKGEPTIQQNAVEQKAGETKESDNLSSISPKITEQEIIQLQREDAKKLSHTRRGLGIIEPMGTSDEKTIRKNVSEVPMPGGRMVGENVEWNKYRNIVEIVQNHFDLSPAELRRMLAVNTPFTENNFYEHLSEETKSPEIFANVVINTMKFILKPDRKDVDEKYVLFYRRTQRSDNPKPEAYWTYDYSVALRGLRQEHPEAYKKTTVILATNL